MPSTPSRCTRIALAAAAFAGLAACGSFDSASRSIAGLVKPYRAEVVQGNFVSKEQVEQLKPGLSRQAVRELLGTPLVTSVFHQDRWDYVFTIRRQGVDEQARRLTLWFKGDALEKFEGDPMPSESEFVASIGAKPRNAGTPVLEASEEQLKAAAARAPATPAAPAPAAPPPANYPPLEPAGR